MIQKPDHVHVVDAPDAFRGKFTGKNAATDYAEQVHQVLEENKGKVAAFIGRDGHKIFIQLERSKMGGPNLKMRCPCELS